MCRGYLAKVLLHKLRADDADEGGGGVMRDGLGQHGLAGAGGTPEQDPPRWVDADLLVQLVLRQRQLHRLPDLLLLNVIAANVLQPAATMVTHAASSFHRQIEMPNLPCLSAALLIPQHNPGHEHGAQQEFSTMKVSMRVKTQHFELGQNGSWRAHRVSRPGM